jgi:hypothetical protein
MHYFTEDHDDAVALKRLFGKDIGEQAAEQIAHLKGLVNHTIGRMVSSFYPSTSCDKNLARTASIDFEDAHSSPNEEAGLAHAPTGVENGTQWSRLALRKRIVAEDVLE